MRALLFAALLPALALAAPRKVEVGSKKFTESVILSELLTQLARAQGIPAEHRRDIAPGGKRALDPVREILDQLRVDDELAIREQLDQHRPEQRIIGSLDGDVRGEPQP